MSRLYLHIAELSVAIHLSLSACEQPMDLSWNPYSCGGLFMSAPSLVDKLRRQECPLSSQFLRALSLCHTVMAQWDKGWLFVGTVVDCCS